MSRGNVDSPLDRKVLRHLMGGGQLRELAPKLGMSPEELACRVDLKRLRDQIGGLRWLQEQAEGMAQSQERAQATRQLGRLLEQKMGQETMRRVCVAILRDPRARRPGPPARRESAAGDFLLRTLSNGARPATEVIQMARRSGISPTTLQRAKGSAHVVTVREGFGRSGRFFWRLPGPAGHGEEDHRQPS